MVLEDLKKSGYGKEEEYFFKLNQKLIEERRKKLDAQKSSQATAQRANPHWMKCPKCGADMKEIALAGIQVDQCGGCQGIYFDQGELETLMESREPKGFLQSLKRLF